MLWPRLGGEKKLYLDLHNGDLSARSAKEIQRLIETEHHEHGSGIFNLSVALHSCAYFCILWMLFSIEADVEKTNGGPCNYWKLLIMHNFSVFPIQFLLNPKYDYLL